MNMTNVFFEVHFMPYQMDSQRKKETYQRTYTHAISIIEGGAHSDQKPDIKLTNHDYSPLSYSEIVVQSAGWEV